jgi:hypothetical protein
MPDLDRSYWTATASSYYDADTSPDKALDGINRQNATFWISDAGFPQYIEIDMHADHELTYIKVFKANTRFYSPVFWGQSHPSLVQVKLYIDGAWVVAGEQVWPSVGDPHFVYIEPTNPPTLVSKFRLYALDDFGRPSYHRFAVSEIYAGKLVGGDPCVFYYKAHPKQFDKLQPGNALDVGYVDWNETDLGNEVALCPPRKITEPPYLFTLTYPVKQQVRVWHTASLAWYPEMLAWDWDFPSDGFLADLFGYPPGGQDPYTWPNVPGLESVSMGASGNGVDPWFRLARPTAQPMICDLELSANMGSNQGYFDFRLPWYYDGTERIFPAVYKLWALPNIQNGEVDSVTLEDLGTFVSHNWIWHSLSGGSPTDFDHCSSLSLKGLYYLIAFRVTVPGKIRSYVR